MRSKQSGFTLIELLVVIAIIGLLASIVLVALSNARMKARDAKRIEQFHQLNVAIQLYAGDHGGSYPACGTWTMSNDSSWSCLVTALAPYIKVPVDPVNGAGWPWSGGYAYMYASYPSINDYDLMGQLEDPTNPLRCQVKNWPFRYFVSLGNPATDSACAVDGYSNQLFEDH